MSDILSMPVSVWTKYSSDTTWCTVNGRSLLYSSTTDPIDKVQCQQLCVESNSRCSAVEFWEEYNYACFECTDLSLAEPYTNENDLAYPVYVWVRSEYKRFIFTMSLWAMVENSCSLVKLSLGELKRRGTKTPASFLHFYVSDLRSSLI